MGEKQTLGLYDSATGEGLRAIKIADVSDKQDFDKVANLLYGEAKRGPLVQLNFGSLYIHWFYKEPEGRRMIAEASNRFGFGVNLLRIVDENAPTTTNAGGGDEK